MTTTISPAAGAGALYTQQGIGTTPGYAALDIRRGANGALQEGVYGTPTLVTAGGVSNVGQADFMVTQRAAGANMSVDVNMPAGGFAWVQGDTINGQGLYCVPVHSANINEVIAASDPTNPRVDQVILEVLDNVLDASGNNVARTRVVTGTPTTGATLANRSGAAALPGSALLLADVLVGATVTTLANAVMRDRRKWARGASFRVKRNINAAAGNDYSTTSSTQAAIDATSLTGRVECSGVPVRVTLTGRLIPPAGGSVVAFWMDGAALESDNADAAFLETGEIPFHIRHDALPAAGSHTFQPVYQSFTNTQTTVVRAQAGIPLTFVVEEVIKQNTANNTVTTG